jgi:4-amino-4-deoxy-L-arabinose transferase-like glycosyltransferase
VQEKNMQGRKSFQSVFSGSIFLILILLGSGFVALSVGRYACEDSKLEYGAATGVLKWGYPYVTFGNLINQPPLGYYIDSVFFRIVAIFGVNEESNQLYGIGVSVITLFGLGCVFLVYELGKTLYGKRTGFLASALLGLTPWQVVMSTTFLIDAQCLFFSLLFLLTGILAIRKGSLKLFLLTGFLFGFAFLTKVFAVFFVIPLLIIFVSSRPKKVVHTIEAAVLFVLPAFTINYLWYGVLTNLGVDFVLHHGDFFPKIPQGIIPSPFFVLNFFSNNLSALFLAACAISFFITVYRRRLFKNFLGSDISLVATLLLIPAIDTSLVLRWNLWIPYVNLFKYVYPLVPLFCLLAASLADKFSIMHRENKTTAIRHKLVPSIALAGLGLLAFTIARNLINLNALIGQEHAIFSVGGGLSISLLKVEKLMGDDYLALIQDIGFALILSSLLLVVAIENRKTKSALEPLNKNNPTPTFESSESGCL